MKSDQQAIEAIIKSKTPRAYITSSIYIQYMMGKYEPGAFYMPQLSEETTFFLDFHSIAFRKDFEFIKIFDKMYEKKYLVHSHYLIP